VGKLATLMVHRSSWNTKDPVWDEKGKTFDDLRIHEAERAMEVPVGHTAMGPRGEHIPLEERFKMLGNAFNVHTVASLLAQGRPHICKNVLVNHKRQRDDQQ